MNKKNFSIAEIMDAVRNNRETMIAVDIEGSIRNYASVYPDSLSLEEFTSLIKSKQHKGCSVSFMKQDKNITEDKILKKIEESIKALKYAQTHKMKPGINIPDKEAMNRYLKIYNEMEKVK